MEVLLRIILIKRYSQAAVKGNNKMSFKEADTLIEQLLQAKNPYTCPHGRPTIISLSR